MLSFLLKLINDPLEFTEMEYPTGILLNLWAEFVLRSTSVLFSDTEPVIFVIPFIVIVLLTTGAVEGRLKLNVPLILLFETRV
jgi:hypothetical protein